MQKIKFINFDELFCVDISRYTSTTYINRIKLVFSSKVNIPSQDILLSGFTELNEHNDYIQGDFSNFTNLYRSFDDGVTFILSDTLEDIYVEPIPEIEPEPYVPTLEEVKEGKLFELSSICNQSIINGVDLVIDENTEHFSYNIEDQNNIDDIFNMASTTNLSQPYHCDHGNCKLYTVEQVSALYTAQKLNKTHHTTYYNQLKSYTLSLKTVKEVESIFYGYKLSGIYDEIYNEMMARAKLSYER